jgi:proteasome activator subunit 4
MTLVKFLLQLMTYREQIIGVLTLLTEKTKSERGYTGTGRLLTRVLHTLAGVYPLNSRFVNSDEWEDPGSLTASFVNA